MDKQRIDTTIDKLNSGWIALARYAPNLEQKVETIKLGDEVLRKLLAICAAEDLLSYACERIILKAPIMNQRLLDIIREVYPEHLELVQKLLVLA